jgi:hypothetical protein
MTATVIFVHRDAAHSFSKAEKKSIRLIAGLVTQSSVGTAFGLCPPYVPAS